MATALISEVNDSNFEQVVLKSEKPVVVDFWAPWCQPCRIIAPIIEELAQEYNGKVIFAKLNTDDNMQTTMRFGIRGIPTLLIFKNGQEVGRIVGARPKRDLKNEIERVLSA